MTQQPTLDDFLAAFFPDETETICLRFFKAKDEPLGDHNAPRVIHTTRRKLRTDTRSQDYLRELNRTRGAYFVVNSGGDMDASITRVNAFFVECDETSIAEQHAAFDRAPLAASARLETRKSVHAYFLLSGACSVPEWIDMQKRLIARFGGDAKNKNPSRVFRLPYFNHVHFDKETGEYETKRVELKYFDATRRYTLQEMHASFPLSKSNDSHSQTAQAKAGSDESKSPNHSASNQTFATFDDLNAELKRRVMSQAKQNTRGIYEMRGLCHNGSGETALCFNPATGKVWCNSGCAYQTILRAHGLPEKPTGNGDKAQSGEASERKLSQASRLVALACQVEFFHTPDDRCFARVPVANHIETASVKSGMFRDWLIREYRRTKSGTPSAQAVQDALTDLIATARYDSPLRECHTRIAEADGAIYVDLCNDAWQAVRITPEGWSIIDSCYANRI